MPRLSPFTETMVSSKVSALRCLLGMLENETITSRADFVDMMEAAFVEGKLDHRILSDDLGFSASTVYRWIDGKSAPHASLWPTIVVAVKKGLAAEIERCVGLSEATAALAVHS